MPEIIDKFFAVDFDRCLGNFEANVDLMNVVANELSVISSKVLQVAHDEIKASGQPFRILQYLEENDPNLDISTLQRMYIERAQNLPGGLIEPGASELIEFLQLNNHSFCIMTFGEERWQTTKIEAAGFGSIAKLIVSHEHKSRHIAEWLDEKSGNFVVPGVCFTDNNPRIAREVILIDDKSNAFTDLPKGARGYLIHNSKSVYSSSSKDMPSSVKRVSCLSEVILHES